MTELQDISEDNIRQWEAINGLTAEVKLLAGVVQAQTDANAQLRSLLKTALSYEFYVILFLIAALVYGAIGREGLFAVRRLLPVPQQDEDDAALLMQPIAPPPDNRFHKT